MHHPPCPRPVSVALTRIALCCGLAAAVAPALHAAEVHLDLQLEQTFENLLNKDADALDPGQRLVPSRRYEPDGDGYSVYAIRDTAGPEALTTERLSLRLLRDAAGGWQVAEHRVEDSAQRLFREAPEASGFFRFAALQLEREGLTIAASAGTAVTYRYRGGLSRIVLAARDLHYDYDPPGELGAQGALYRTMQRQWKNDFVFAPTVVEIACDPASCEAALDAFTDLQEADDKSLDEALALHYATTTRDLREARAKDPFEGFRLPEPEDKRWYRIAVRRDEDHALTLEYDSLSDHEIRFSADGFETIYGYPARASRLNAEPADIERRDDPDAEAYQLTALTGTVELGVVEAELLQADLTFTIQAKRPIDALPFSLEAILVGGQAEKKATLHVNSLEDGNGRTLSWVRGGLADGVVLLPETLPTGSEMDLHMRFETKGSLVKVNPSYSYVSRSGWLPFVRYHDTIDRFDLTVEVPSRYTALGVGTAAGEPRQQGRTNVSHWVAHGPVHFPTVIFGDYRVDSPKTTATKSDGTEIPVTVYVDRTAMTEWGIRPGQLRSPGEIAVNALNVYRELFGMDYPYGKLDLVNDPLQATGAQAPASIVYLGSAIFRSEATLNSATLADTTSLVEERISHEVAHQWWGSLVSSANRRNYWFIESLAEYSSALFMEVLESEGYQKPEKGRKAYLAQVGRWRGDVLNSGLLASVQDSSTLWTNGGYIEAVYDRGPYAFHMLRETFGDPKFFAFLKTLARELAGREIVTRDIQDVAEQAFGGTGEDGRPYTVDLEWFFDQWIRGVGLPEYTFQHTVRQAENGGYVVEGKIGQRVFVGKHDVELKGLHYRGVVPVTVLGSDKKEYGARVVVQGAETPFAFKVPTKPLEVTLNKHDEILARPVLER